MRVVEHNRIKRVPVLHKKKLIGIITRANLLRALVGAAKAAPKLSLDDAAIRERLLADLEKQPWAPGGGIDIAVSNGVVTLSGVLTDDRQRQALCVAAENIAGVKRVEDQLTWLVLGSEIIGTPPLIIGPVER